MDVNFSVCFRRNGQQHELQLVVQNHSLFSRGTFHKYICFVVPYCAGVRNQTFYHFGDHACFPLSKVGLLSSRVGRYPIFTRTKMDSTPTTNTWIV